MLLQPPVQGDRTTMTCRRCHRDGADSDGLCWDCVQARFNWTEQMIRDKFNADKIGWPEFPETEVG